MTNISLLNKEKCSIAVLETATSVRQMYIDAFTRTGFKPPLPFSDVNTFAVKIETDYFDWCILSLDNLRSMNLPELFNNLFLKSKNPDIIISVVNDHNEDHLLPSLFEQGLLSNFSKTYSIEPFEEQLLELLKLTEVHKGNYSFVAGEYIRFHLKKRKFYRSLLQQEESILDLFPGSARCLLKLAEAQCLNQNLKTAANTIAQAEFIEPKIKPLSDILRKKYLKNLEVEPETEHRNILGIRDCVIIDSDTDVQYYVSESLAKLGITECQCFSDGESAIKYLSQCVEPKLIIMEWKIPIINGGALVQRIRKLGFYQSFILVISSLVKKSELSLLQEVGVDAVLEKPFDAEKLSKELIAITQHARKPSEQRSLERKIRTLFATNRMGEAERLLAEYMNHPLISEESKLHLRAEYEYNTQNYNDATTHALEVLKRSGESVLLFALLGKCFLKLRDFDNAANCFKRAHALSPTNVDRILSLVDLKIVAGDVEEADNLLKEAKNVDATRTDVVEMECRLAIQKSDTKTAENLLSTLESLTGVVGMINNDAVAQIRAGQFEDGMKLYKQALTCLPISAPETREFITYNLSLAYARYGDLEGCLQVMKSVQIPSTAKIFIKFQSFQKRVEVSVENGTKLEFHEHIEEKPKNDSAKPQKIGHLFEEISKKLEIKKGSRCCYKIYYRIEKDELS